MPGSFQIEKMGYMRSKSVTIRPKYEAWDNIVALSHPKPDRIKFPQPAADQRSSVASLTTMQWEFVLGFPIGLPRIGGHIKYVIHQLRIPFKM